MIHDVHDCFPALLLRDISIGVVSFSYWYIFTLNLLQYGAVVDVLLEDLFGTTVDFVCYCLFYNFSPLITYSVIPRFIVCVCWSLLCSIFSGVATILVATPRCSRHHNVDESSDLLYPWQLFLERYTSTCLHRRQRLCPAVLLDGPATLYHQISDIVVARLWVVYAVVGIEDCVLRLMRMRSHLSGLQVIWADFFYICSLSRTFRSRMVSLGCLIGW